MHQELELALAAWKGTEAAVCFPTGFAANLGVLATLGGPGVRVLSDELNHASIIDGCRLSRSNLAVFRHRDMDHLAALLSSPPDLAEGHDAVGPTLVVTDSVFSMDGDTAPLDDLLPLCARHGALVVLDEAHAVLGPRRRVSDADPFADAGPIVRVGTLSKTLGSLGGFVAASRDVVDLLVNRARPYIFSTAATPADAAAALAALRVLRARRGRGIGRPPRLPDRPGVRGRPGAARPCRARSFRSSWVLSRRRSTRPPRCWLRPVGPRHPAADRPRRHEPVAGHPVGRPHRRRRDAPARCAGRARVMSSVLLVTVPGARLIR